MNALVECLEEIDYWFARTSRGYQMGQHRSMTPGAGFTVKGYDTLCDRPDFSRIDWIQTILSGSKIPLVKVVEQKSAITMVIMVDVSASMGIAGWVHKTQELAKFATAMCFSAYKVGDRFSLVAYGDEVEAFFEPRASRAYALEIGEWLWNFSPRATSSKGLKEACDFLPQVPSLVCWLGDFHMSFEAIEECLRDIAETHDVTPMIFWDSAECARLPRWGLAWLRDAESGEERLELFTPARVRAVASDFTIRRGRLISLFRKFDVEPLMVLDAFRPVEVAEFFFRRRGLFDI